MSIEQEINPAPVIDQRLQAIRNWIEKDLGLEGYQLDVASADASFRRYFRLIAQNNSWIIMDAPPDKENCEPFVKIAKLIEAAGVHAPHIFSFNQQQGFMQLSDLGSTAYLDQLNAQSVDELYADAIQAIVKMQSIQAELPEYKTTLLHTEMFLFKDWYLHKHLAIELNDSQNKILDTVFQYLVDSALQQPEVFVHRDYHSRNLMIIKNNNPGVIDFQDAVNGPASYDLVSLIKDCYISWPREKQLQWIDQYLALTPIDTERESFIKHLDLMGMQRHLKAIGIFARLNYRDGKPGYMNDIPRTLAYVHDVCQRYEELAAFTELLVSLGISADRNLLEKIQ